MNTPKKINAEFEIKFQNKTDAEVVFKTIEPELGSSPSDRSSVCVNAVENVLYLCIDAVDTASLRATVNSYLRWIKLSDEMNNILNSKK